MKGVKLSLSEWQEISAALLTKEGEIRRGDYQIPMTGGTPSEKRAHMAKEARECREWAQRLAKIRRKIDGNSEDGMRAAALGVQAVNV